MLVAFCVVGTMSSRSVSESSVARWFSVLFELVLQPTSDNPVAQRRIFGRFYLIV